RPPTSLRGIEALLRASPRGGPPQPRPLGAKDRSWGVPPHGTAPGGWHARAAYTLGQLVQPRRACGRAVGASPPRGLEGASHGARSETRAACLAYLTARSARHHHPSLPDPSGGAL